MDCDPSQLPWLRPKVAKPGETMPAVISDLCPNQIMQARWGDRWHYRVRDYGSFVKSVEFRFPMSTGFQVDG